MRLSLTTLDASDLGRRHGARRTAIPYWSVRYVVALVDVVLIVSSSVLAGFTYHKVTSGTPGDIAQFISIGALFSALFTLIAHGRSTNSVAELMQFHRQVRQVALAWAQVFAFLLLASFLWKTSSDFSRGAVATFAVTCPIVLWGARAFWMLHLRRAVSAGRLHGKRIAVIAADDSPTQNQALSSTLDKWGYERVCFIALPSAVDGEAGQRFGKEVEAQLRGSMVEEIILVADIFHRPDLSQIMLQLQGLPLPVQFLADESVCQLLRCRQRELDSGMLLEMQPASLSGTDKMIKAVAERILAAFALFALLPLLILVAVMIKLDSRGPIFFRQTRRGFNGRPFKIWKFRTMKVMEDGATVTQATRHDCRVTAVGAWLRSSSVDELPQLLNVLNGDMSFVGPRPHAVAHDDHFLEIIADYAQRHNVKPGLTGWAQVNGARGETPTLESMVRRITLDLWYVKNWSLALDVRIVIRTFGEVLTSRSAY